jgi:redox-sensitive bicupin YhaK (pirin superfamily)
MSNVESAPVEITCGTDPAKAQLEVLEPRLVPLGGARAMQVRRTLPQRARSLIGAWCFVDHYGPDDVAAGMAVPGHPHTGLQTVSWLFDGQIEHRDTTGAHALVRPGEVNLMTAGSGIAHSEFSTPDTRTLHGVQLWIALPDRHRQAAPAFEHHTPRPVERDGARILVLAGALAGDASPITTYSPLLGAEIGLAAGARLHLDVDAGFEHGVLVDTGDVTVDGVRCTPGQLLFRPPCDRDLVIEAAGSGPARVMLLGGEPFDEQIIMWWNFIGRTHGDIVGFRNQWQAERAGETDGTGRFGRFPDAWDHTLPAPELPNARLTPRR